VLDLALISKYLQYDPVLGDVYFIKEAKPARKLVPDETNRILTTVAKQKLKIKADRLIWYLVYKHQPTRNQIIFHKNLDPKDNRILNLSLITKTEYLRIIEAMKNISGTLKLLPHPTDAFCYVLQYKLHGRLRKEVVSDITIAKRKFVRLQLKFVKLIGKFTYSE
jgi:hypothetical protein